MYFHADLFALHFRLFLISFSSVTYALALCLAASDRTLHLSKKKNQHEPWLCLVQLGIQGISRNLSYARRHTRVALCTILQAVAKT